MAKVMSVASVQMQALRGFLRWGGRRRVVNSLSICRHVEVTPLFNETTRLRVKLRVKLRGRSFHRGRRQAPSVVLRVDETREANEMAAGLTISDFDVRRDISCVVENLQLLFRTGVQRGVRLELPAALASIVAVPLRAKFFVGRRLALAPAC